jgi:hypothetical protein
MMQERLVTSTEAAAIFLKGLGRHRWIAEARMALNVWRLSFVHIAPRGNESIVKTLPGNIRILRRRRWFVINWMWMRTSRQ